MKRCRKALVGVLIVGGTMSPISCLYAGNWGAIGGAADAIQEMTREAMRLEMEKRAVEHRMKLEEESRQRQREYDERRRQEALQKQQEEDARLKELARRKAEEERRLAISTGTGFFVAPDGYLVTNNHVIDEKTDYAVRDFKGRFYRTHLIARDPKRDLALLKVAGNFPALRIAHSDTVSKGQHVFAVGYPQVTIQGNESKVTDGIISSFSGISNDDNWFQVSVPIQGGNSGGPLVTEGGNVVGVVVASVNVSRFYAKAGTLPQNVNYAIKSKLVFDFLKANGVKNIPSVPSKVSLDTVDSATAMVIAKNGPIEVAYTVSQEQTALLERERRQQAAEEEKQRKVEAQAEKRRLAIAAAEESEEKKRQSAIKKEETASRLSKVFKDCADCPEMVIVPAGSFEMGSNDGESDERPMHRVSIDGAFALAKTEVTQRQWRSVMGSNPSQFSKFGDDHPVEHVNWHDAQEFVQKLSKKTGKVYRLPSEAEWEYACRAGGQHAYCGSDNIDGVAWIEGNSSFKTHSVAGKQANAWGLFDMSGNVLEWTADCGNDNYSGAPADGGTWGRGNCAQRVLRGGSWFFVPYAARASIRLRQDSSSRSAFFGFRPARSLP